MLRLPPPSKLSKSIKNIGYVPMLRDCSEFLVRWVVLYHGGYQLLTRYPGGGEYFAKGAKWGYPFFTHTQKNRTWQNAPFAQFPPLLWTPLLRFAIAALNCF